MMSIIKRMLAVLALALIGMASAQSSAWALCGDYDGDSRILSNDLLSAARAAIGVYSPNATQVSRTDAIVSGTPDGKLLSNDLLLVSRASVDSSMTLLCNDAVMSIFTDAGQSSKINNINTTSENEEFFLKMIDPVTAWNASYTTHSARRVAVKDIAMSMKYGENFTNNDVKDALTSLRSGYQTKLQTDGAVTGASLIQRSVIQETDIGSTISVYDIARGLLIETFVKDVGTTRKTALTATEGLMSVLARLGTVADTATGKEDLLNKWVTEWDTPALQADLMAFLAPLEMDDPSKTKDMMRLVRELMLNGGSDAQVEAAFNKYYPQATSAAMTFYLNNKSRQCQLGVDAGFNVTFTNCPSTDEMAKVAEAMYGKPLPKLRLFLDGMQNRIKSLDTLTKFALGNAVGSVQKFYNGMVNNPADKPALSDTLRTAGVRPELFWLAIAASKYLM